MKSRLLSALFFLFFLFSLQNLSAQTNLTVEITGPSVLCPGQCDTFFAVLNNSPSPNVLLYKWLVTGPSGLTFTGATDKFFFCPPADVLAYGNYTLLVQVTNANGGAVASDTFGLQVVSFIPLDIISNNPAPCNLDSTNNDPSTQSACERVCPNTTVTYSVTLSNPPGGSQTALSWNVQGATSYTVNPPFFNSVTVNWGGTGAGFVSVVSDGQGCSGEDALCVTIIAEPVAAFTADPAPNAGNIQVCKGQTVYFENQSTGADSYEWLFSDNQALSPDIDVQHTFLAPGNYTVRLIARSDCLCADTTTVNVEVLDATAPSLDCVGTICPGESVTYTAAGACPPYAWSVTPNGVVLSGGTATEDSITVQWTGGPEGIITLGAQPCSGNACPIPANIHVPVISDDAEIRGAGRVCPGAEEIYTIEAYGGTGFVWSLSGGGKITEGQGTSRVTIEWTNLPNPNTTYWLSVKYDNCYLGCGGEDSIAVQVLSPFILNGPVERCESGSGSFTSKLTFNGQDIASNWTVYAPDGSVAWTSSAPTAAASGPFANGPGIYRILAVPDNPLLTCSDQAEWVVSVTALPAKPAGISGETKICPNTAYTYEATGVTPGNNLRWTVQNGPGAPVVSFGDKINVTWGNANPRQIAVAQVTNNGLNCASDTAMLTVQPIGLIFISGNQVVCENATGTYSIPGLQNVDIQWNISPATAGAVTSGQGTNAVEIFWSEPGGHVVSIDVCGQSTFLPVTVIAPPDPMVQYASSVCPGLASAVQTTTPYATYSWRDVAGVELTDSSTTNLVPGSYFVSVTDVNGCSGSTEFSITESPAPNLSITTADPTGFCNNSVFVTLTALTNSDGDLTYEWFRSGTPLGVNAPTLTTNQYGIYTVQATNSYGCTAVAGSISLFNYCGGGAGGGFPGGGLPPCPPGTVDFTVNATAKCDAFQFQLVPGPQYQTGSAQWAFAVSGGTILGTSTDENPGFVFPNAGKYIAVLQATLQNGTTCLVVDSVRVDVAAQFTFTPECAGQASGFADISTFLPGSGITAWNWDFGDPASGGNNTSNVRNPTHVYSAAGTPTITLTVTATAGCTSSVSQAITIFEGNQATFVPPLQNCAGNALEFVAVTTPDMSEVTWNFGDPASGASNDAAGTPAFHSFSSSGNYTVTTTATNAYGCTATYAQNVSIVANSLSGNITPANPGPICEGASISLSAPPGATSYLWSDSTTTTQNLSVNEAGVYSVTLTDAGGCSYTPPPVKVDVAPGPDAIIKALLQNELGQIIGTAYPSLTVCEGEDVKLIIQANGLYTYVWSGGNGTNDELTFSNEFNNQLTVGVHPFTVTVTDGSNGCTSVVGPFVITVNPKPAGFAVTLAGGCAGSPNQLTYTGPQPANWQYIWSNGATGTSLSTEDAGLYYIRVVNEYGCEAKSNTVTVLPGPYVTAIPGGCHSRCRPDSICLPPVANIAAWQWYFNGSPIPGATGPGFTATESGVYYAELTDSAGCVNQSDPLTLELFDGLGNVLGQVWSDVNNNGVIDAGDTLVSGIQVDLIQNGSVAGTEQSAGNGTFGFVGVQASSYTVKIDSALLSGNWQIVIGQEAVVLFGCNGLDSADLLIRNCPSTGSSLVVNVCPNEVYDYNGTLLSAGETQAFVFPNFQGCDSIVTVTVLQVEESASSLAVSICPGDTYDYNGTPLSAGQTQDFHFQNQLGCDSTVTVTVSALPVSASGLDVKVCPGATYNYNGTPLSVGQTQDFVLQNYLGCDSVVTVTVSALSVSASTLNVKVCQGATYDYNGTLLAGGQSQDFILQNYLGCDSVVTVNVTEYEVGTMIVDAMACAGDTLYYNGVGIPAGSDYTFTYQNAAGCDSLIVVVGVAELPPPAAVTRQVGVCPGEVYNYQGVNIAAGDSATFLLPAVAFGCDTPLTIVVTALPVSTFALDAKVCPGQAYPYQGVNLGIGTVTDFTFTNSAGCDSVVTVTVSAFPTVTEPVEVDVCPGTVYVFNGIEIAPGETAEFHYLTTEGCDSMVTVSVGAFPEASFAVEPETSCATQASGSLTVTSATGGLAPYRYSLDGTAYQDSTVFGAVAAGDYTVYLEDSNGCIFEEEATVDAFPRLELALPDGILPCDNSGTRLEAVLGGDLTDLKIRWSSGDTMVTYIDVNDPGLVWVEATNHCETVRREAAVDWADLSAKNFIYVPNVFKPASTDPDNSAFRPYFNPDIQILSYRFEVFDRWGNKMYHSDQPGVGWNGNFRAEEMRPGVFVWYLKVRYIFCGYERELLLEGDVTVVR